MPLSDLHLLDHGKVVQSFSGADFDVIGYIPPFGDVETEPNASKTGPHSVADTTGDVFIHNMASLQTMSISTTRDTKAARKLGRSWAFDFSQGARSVAGSLVFATLDGDAFQKFHAAHAQNPQSSREDADYYHADNLPAFNIIFKATNESGVTLIGALLGVVLINTGTSFGIHDIYTEQVYSYVAVRYEPLKLLDPRTTNFNVVQNPLLAVRPAIEAELRRLYGNNMWMAPKLAAADEMSRRSSGNSRSGQQPDQVVRSLSERVAQAAFAGRNVFEE